ncbi:uncharacterized protein BXZ73DRAFT_93201 [Epithele typhae]|uniref:uncharacterized protein n=1 Tax=Epithele typhae TaxID=378194 RepID=UPI0020084255|nr:uncharacterized protein BXZ73DRAFT_93201 [Epithele typhae]KAH9912361.1 hypothetical protein BXZ73DRAFT_93201 [Epithele typhae]
MTTRASAHGAQAFVSLDDVVTRITTTPPTAQLAQFLRTFAQKETRDAVLASTLGSGQDPLAVLDPVRNTLGYLFVLSARLQGSTLPSPPLSAIEDFCSTFEPEQARLAPDRVTLLAKGILRVAEQSANPKYAIRSLASLVARYPPSPSYLTTLHPIFVRVCVATGHYASALPVLSVPITNVDTSVSDLTYNDHLVYHYAGGVALGALKRWREAEEFFEICVSAPAQVPAAIQLEAFKKLALVQLIQYGETVPPPKYTLPALVRMFKNTSYNTFIKNYPSTTAMLRTWVTKEADMLNTDQNTGLVNQAIERAPVWLIKKLTATYLTLGLSDIKKQAGIETVEQCRETILSMIDAGEINGSISADDTVTFADPVPEFTKEELDRLLVSAQHNSALLAETERALNTSKEYLTKATKAKDDSGWGADEDMYGANSMMGGSGHAPWADEVSFA